MAGDRAGILTFGHDMDEAVNVLMSYLQEGEINMKLYPTVLA